MPNVLFLTNQWTELATWQTATSGSGADPNNLIHPNPRRFWFSNSTTAAAFEFQRTQNTPLVDTLYPAYTKIGPNGTWRARGWTPPQTINSPEFDTGVLTFQMNSDLEGYEFTHSIHRLPSPVSVTNIHIDLTDDGSSGQPIQVGIFRAARAFVPQQNVDRRQFAIGPTNNSRLLETFGGTPKVDARPEYSTLQLNMTNQHATDAHEFEKLARFYGNRVPVVVAIDYDGSWMSHPSDGLGYFLLDFDSPPVKASANGGFNRWDVPITGREFI